MKTAYIYRNPEINSETNSEIQVTEFFSIGTEASCNLQLFGTSISERHARIEWRSDLYIIRDLQSKTGTFVNNTRIQEAYLKEGDEIRVGTHSLVFSYILKAKDQESFGLTSKNRNWNQELSRLAHVASTEFPVLLLGPSGTGKEVIAEALHKGSKRKLGPFIRVNCSAMTESLAESELFGHIKGSFTGAIETRKGAFESARGGTLFLDEIGDLPYAIQAKLLRALENNEIRPVGSDQTIETDVRIIAATHQNLLQKIKDDRFRIDLFYRLNVIQTQVPLLKERLEDFEDLLYHFGKKYRVRFSFGAIESLKRHEWVGNIRELRNTVSRAAAYFAKQEITEDHVPKILDFTSLPIHQGVIYKDTPSDLSGIKDLEKQIIIEKLSLHYGNQRKTAADLGIPKSTLHDRLRTYQINPKLFMKPFRRPATVPLPMTSF